MTLDVTEPAGCVPGGPLDASHISLTGPHSASSSAFDVDGLLADSAAFAFAAIDRFGARHGQPTPGREIDLGHLLAYCTTHVEIDCQPVPAWSDLSGVYPTRDGRHLQIHCNFPQHADGVVQRLNCSPDPAAVAAAIAERDAFELEGELIDAGLVGAAVRTLDEWNAHPHALVTRDLPLIDVERIADADPVIDETHSENSPPLRHVRVLDCSRVLAGPVAGRTLADFGADVVRVGADHLPSVPVGVMSTGFGKRNVSLDLRTTTGADHMHALMGAADVWIDAYRPGALAGLGLTPERAALQRPGVVVVQVSAFDWVGPWAGRRGFDSIVQSTTGVRSVGGQLAVDGAGRPLGRGLLGLPVQALDYATGFLAAGVAARLLAHQRRAGGSWLARLSLLRTRNHLVGRAAPAPFEPANVEVDPRFLHRVESDFGRLSTVRPVAGAVRSVPRQLGSSDPRWTV